MPLLGPQGIFKPAMITVPLSMTTVPSGPYDDGFDGGGVLHYRYRGTDPFHRDNAGLRTHFDSTGVELDSLIALRAYGDPG